MPPSKPRSKTYPACVIADPASLKPRVGSTYPEPFRSLSATREKRPLGDAVGLKNFGVNLTTLPPGCWSSQRHYHAKQDELVYIVDGELTLVTDEGETVLTAGMVAGFKAGDPNGHCLINKSNRDAHILEIGDRTPGDSADYSDIDMQVYDHWPDGRLRFRHKNGDPY
jgi:uncharacterized cupin superfamily protein